MPRSGSMSTVNSANAIPVVEDVNRISSVGDPVIRNLQITACYHELSKAFINFTGSVANWCTFATWASKQAGVTIRGEDLDRKFETALANSPEVQEILLLLEQQLKKFTTNKLQGNLIASLVQRLAKSAKEKASTAVGKGNKKVFEEIAVEFARFIPACCHDLTFKKSSIDEFCKSLRPGLPPDGQEHLAFAFNSYYRSMFETDVKMKDELILYANIQIGLHEQTRLQPEIAESMDASKIDSEAMKKYLTDLLIREQTITGKIFYFFTWLIGGTKLFKATVDRLVNTAETHIRMIITKNLMTLTFPPNNCLQLGDSITHPIPSNLEIFTDADLVSLLKNLQPSPDAIAGAGCKDWADLKHRVYFIAHLFRCYHSSGELLISPYSTSQLAEIHSGRVPEGNL